MWVSHLMPAIIFGYGLEKGGCFLVAILSKKLAGVHII